jgi:hypothetical protein
VGLLGQCGQKCVAGSFVTREAAVLDHWMTLQVAAKWKVPSHCSLKKTQVVVKANRFGRHKDSLGEEGHTDAGPAASSMTAVDTHSGRVPTAQPKLVREQLQPCVVDARQHTIASGSCCCSSLGGRSCPDVRKVSFVAAAHAQGVRHDSRTVRFALERVS